MTIVRRLYVHIGTHKTGTTTIQAFVNVNAAALKREVIHVAQAGRYHDQSGHHYIAADLRGEPITTPRRWGGLDALIDELAHIPQHKALITSENLEYLVDHPEAIRAFEARLAAIGWTPHYLVYFREQTAYLISLYHELLKHGLTLSFDAFVADSLRERHFRWQGDRHFWFDYREFVRRWRQATDQPLTCISYERARMGAGVVKTFLDAIGCKDRGDLADVEPLNVGTYRQGQADDRLRPIDRLRARWAFRRSRPLLRTPATHYLTGEQAAVTSASAGITHGRSRWQPAARSPRALLRRIHHAGADLAYRLVNRGQNNGRVVVYTAVTDGFDALLPPQVIHPDIDYIAFVDDPALEVPPPWQKRPITITARNPRVTSRYYKLLPHRLFPDHAVSIWVNANLTIRSDLSSLIAGCLPTQPLHLYAHFLRDCIYEEGAIIEALALDPDRVPPQMAHYRAIGYPPRNGLYANGVMVRHHHHPRVRRAMEDWWIEVQAHSQRDQLSGPVVLARNRLRVSVIDGHIQQSEHFQWRQHGAGGGVQPDAASPIT